MNYMNFKYDYIQYIDNNDILPICVFLLALSIKKSFIALWFIEKNIIALENKVMNISWCLKFTTSITIRCTVYYFLKHDDHYVSAEASNISPLFSSLSVKENLF